MFSINDVEEYEINNKVFSNNKIIEEFISNSIRNNDIHKIIECIQILWRLLSIKDVIYTDRIENYIFPENVWLTLALLLDISKDTEKVHIDNIKVGDIVEKHVECKTLFYKVIKITNKFMYFKPYRKDRKYTGIEIFEEDEKQKNIRVNKIYVASIFYNGGYKILENDKKLIRVKPLFFDTLYK